VNFDLFFTSLGFAFAICNILLVFKINVVKQELDDLKIYVYNLKKDLEDEKDIRRATLAAERGDL